MTRQNLPVPAPVIEPYTGTRDQVLDQILQAQTAGRLVRTHPIRELDNGLVLVVTELRPETDPPGEAPPAGEQSRFARWSPYLLAVGTVLAVVLSAVVLYLLGIGLVAAVQWGQANALTIGAVVIVAFVGALVFLAALTRARQSTHPAGRYYR